MNQTDLARILHKKFGLPNYLAERIIRTILNAIVVDIKKGNLARLRNFGTFRAAKSHGRIRAKFDDSNNIFKAYGKEKK